MSAGKESVSGNRLKKTIKKSWRTFKTSQYSSAFHSLYLQVGAKLGALQPGAGESCWPPTCSLQPGCPCRFAPVTQ